MSTVEDLAKIIGECVCDEEDGRGCPNQSFGLCGEVARMSSCAVYGLAQHLVDRGVTVKIDKE